MTEDEIKWLGEIGQRLELLERAVERSSKDIAWRLEVPPGTWSTYLRGKRWLPVALAGKLRDLYGAGVEWTYFGKESVNEPEFQRKLERAMREPPAIKRGPKPKRPKPNGA